jgi:hypothetical protein
VTFIKAVVSCDFKKHVRKEALVKEEDRLVAQLRLWKNYRIWTQQVIPN